MPPRPTLAVLLRIHHHPIAVKIRLRQVVTDSFTLYIETVSSILKLRFCAAITAIAVGLFTKVVERVLRVDMRGVAANI